MRNKQKKKGARSPNLTASFFQYDYQLEGQNALQVSVSVCAREGRQNGRGRGKCWGKGEDSPASVLRLFCSEKFSEIPQSTKRNMFLPSSPQNLAPFPSTALPVSSPLWLRRIIYTSLRKKRKKTSNPSARKSIKSFFNDQLKRHKLNIPTVLALV